MKQRLINYLLSYLLCAIDPHNVIKSENGIIKLGDEQISNQEITALQSEIRALEHMRIWSILTETLRKEAMDMSFNKSTSFDDLKTGKLMLYNIDIQKSIIKLLKEKKVTKGR